VPAGGAISGHEGGRGFEAGEVVVLGNRPETLARVQSLGFRVIEVRPLSSLGLSVLSLLRRPAWTRDRLSPCFMPVFPA
jgi:hypothetical protein